jgi:hypothetical protein
MKKETFTLHVTGDEGGVVKRERRKRSGHAVGVIEFGLVDAGCDRYVD